MHPTVYDTFEQILRAEETSGRVLEVGAVPNEESLLSSEVFENSREKVGVNLEGGSHADFNIVEANANDMNMFNKNQFDCIVCNATLEHDKYFWKTLSEIRRVADDSAVICIGVPGYTTTKEYPATLHDSVGFYSSKMLKYISSAIKNKSNQNIRNISDKDKPTKTNAVQKISNKVLDLTINRLPSDTTTTTYKVHEVPGDYYRFSTQAVEEVFLKMTDNKKVVEVLQPPRLIGKGIYNP